MLTTVLLGTVAMGLVRADDARTTPPTPLYVVAITADSPAGYWRLDELAGTTAADTSGNGGNGTFLAVARGIDNPGMAEGNPGVGYTGTTQHVLVPNSTGLSPTAAVTIETWVTVTSVSSAQIFVAKNGSYDLGIVAGGRITLTIGTQSYYSVNALSANTWTHVAVTFNGTAATFYVNGVQKDTILGVRSIPTNTENVRLGRSG